jgi:Putative peptidoglycan binding domain
MSLLFLIPNERYRYVMNRGMTGWDVATLQIAFNASVLVPKLEEDGDFGPLTESAAKGIQNLLHITVDGIVGPETQSRLCIQECNKAEINTTPKGLIKGICLGESSGIIPATSSKYSNGSRDYGPLQDNMLNPTQVQLNESFRPGLQAQRVGKELENKYHSFLGQPGAKSAEEAWKLAVLNYNWPAGAQAIANGEEKTWMYTESGTNIKRKLTDNAPWVEQYGISNVKTGLQWSNFYISSKIVYITSWTV